MYIRDRFTRADFIGIDLAWLGGKNTSAVSVAKLENNGLHVVNVIPSIAMWSDILRLVSELDNVRGIAIDAPLIIGNTSGLRPCERELNKEYGKRYAGALPTNLSLYPDADAVKLSEKLTELGYVHCNREGNFQIEVYPHPAIIEIFGLPQRHQYKKGRAEERRDGQVKLSNMIKELAHSSVLPLHLSESLNITLDEIRIKSLRGRRLKENEDALDSIICVYMAGLYQRGITKTFGSVDDGYIVVPTAACIS
jgi:predicted RNase H-like nuclease